MEQKRPQLNLDELHQLKWLLGGALALVSVWSAFYFEVDSWALTLAVTVLVPIMLARPDWAARWPIWAHRLAFPVIGLAFACDFYVTGQLLPALIRLDMLLLLYRATSLRRRREDLQLIVLGLFLIVIAGVLTVSLAFAAQILAFTACALVFMLVITLVDAKEASMASGARAVSPPNWTRVRWRRLIARLRAVMNWRVVALSGTLFLGVVGLSALLFLAIPRFELANSFFLDRLIARHTHTGFSEVVRFGDVTDIMQDESVALRVEPPGRSRPPAELYWRMVVLDEYRRGEFRASAMLNMQVENLLNENVVRGRERGNGAGAWTFYLEPGVSRYLPLAGGFSELRLGEATDLRVNRQTRVIALRSEPATMVAYRATGMGIDESLPDMIFSRRHIASDHTTGRRGQGSHYLEVNLDKSDSAVLKKFADEIDGGASSGAAEFSRRAITWLDRRHGYSLQMRLPEGRGDPLMRWLESGEPGHCELFAGGLVMLARAAGYPARMVAGFRGGDWNAFENYLMVRNSDAHAWCEVFDAATGSWLREDPTPGATATSSASSSAQEVAKGFAATNRSWSARFDSLRLLWYRHIVNFDQTSQRDTLHAVKLTTQKIGQRLKAAVGQLMAELRVWLIAPWSARRAEKFLAGAVVAVALIFMLRRARWRWRFGPKSGADPIRREAGRWLARIADGRLQAEAGVKADLQRLRFGARVTWSAPDVVFKRVRRLARRPRASI
ncbi:MAG: DUF3488 domain-containing protein [Verrucomicrobiota bacterium]|nr:DUF3488 domain-containing protein [Verrucomicrobiota bacterium]